MRLKNQQHQRNIIYVVDKNEMKPFKGFTLLEMLLVIVIMTAITIMAINYSAQKMEELRRDRATLQVQQILNAALTYYVNNSKWPAQCGGAPVNVEGSTLQTSQYLPPGSLKGPWGQGYFISCNDDKGNFYVKTSTIGTSPQMGAQILAGRLPLAFVSDAAGSILNPPTQGGCATPGPSCTYVVASVTVPGQSLSNARSVNFASVYHNGACVPAPTCPPNMKPAIFVAPAAVSGVYDMPTCDDASDPKTCKNVNTYPVNSFTAFARGGDASGAPAADRSPLDCKVVTDAEKFPCDAPAYNAVLPATDPIGTKYWRVCLSVTTERGLAYPPIGGGTYGYNQGKLIGSILAITRCVPNDGTESPSGSPFTVWTPNQGWNP